MAKTAAVSTPIEALLKERRRFTPPKDFVKNANINRPSIYKEAARNPAKFWEGWARQLRWFKPWKKTVEWIRRSPLTETVSSVVSSGAALSSPGSEPRPSARMRSSTTAAVER